MDRLFLDAASERRRFLDRLVFGLDPNHAHHVSLYNHALRERYALLKQASWDPKWLDIIEQSLMDHGYSLTKMRIHATQAMNKLASWGPFPMATLHLEGVFESWVQTLEEDKVKSLFAAHLLKERDRFSKGTSIGPHRADLHVLWEEKAIHASQASTGEQKALLISIVLSNALLQTQNHGVAPLLLLDEGVAHLDKMRRSALFEVIAALKSQVWFTGVEASLFAAMPSETQFYDLEKKDPSCARRQNLQAL
jgi:DNA replication and repair protein RecF